MVQVFADPASPQPVGHTPTSEHGDGTWSKQDGGVMSREEHAQRMRELNMKRGVIRAPRRGWSMTEYQGEGSAPTPPHIQVNPFERQPSIPEHAVLPVTTPSIPSTPLAKSPEPTLTQQLPRRPKLPPPRRSYSVMDYEPAAPPGQPAPSHRLTLLDLPSELHYSLFDHLDPIDSVCFALAHPNLYAIHRRKHPRPVPLSARYSGPNDMEWAWRGAGPLRRAQTFMAVDTASELRHMRVQGQVYCRKCGVSRCELHRHLKDWMGKGMEYCEIRGTYGKTPGEDAKAYCHMSSPKNPKRCGRHGGKKTA